MFLNCSSLENLDISNFNTTNVTNMGSMFSGCSNLTKLDLGKNFNTENVQDMKWMFTGCSRFHEDIQNNLNNVEGIINFFKGKNK